MNDQAKDQTGWPAVTVGQIERYAQLFSGMVDMRQTIRDILATYRADNPNAYSTAPSGPEWISLAERKPVESDGGMPYREETIKASPSYPEDH